MKFKAYPTLSNRMLETGGRSSGFDYLRLCLSVSVVLFHSVSISYGSRFNDAFFLNTPLRPLYLLALPMFFALSGFLVAGSLERSKTITGFLCLRFIRIYPALTVEVLLSAFIFGPMVTDLGLAEYFSNTQFRHYLLNVFGDIHYLLPGVFNDNPMPLTVNGQLWTVPFELLCYISITAMALIGGVKHRIISLLSIPIMTVALIFGRFCKYNGHFPEPIGAFSGSLLLITFLSGLVLFLYRDEVPWSGRITVICTLIAATLVGLVPFGEYGAPVPIAYITIYLGLTNYKRAHFLRHADLSYGIFLYGYVVQQTIAHFLPWSRHWYLNFSIALPITAVVAAASWHFVERPALRLRPYFTKVEVWSPHIKFKTAVAFFKQRLL